MLYPDFNDLMAQKGRRSGLIHPSHRLVKSTVPGNHHSPFRGQGMEFDAVREYVPGDDIRSIDWRVTARTGSPHLKVFKVDRERHIMLCVDVNATMRFGTKNTFKSIQAARAASFLGWNGIAHQDSVGGCLFGDVLNGIQFFPPKRFGKSFSSFLKTLANPPSEHHDVPLEDVLKQVNQVARTGSLIYVISDFMRINKHLQNDAHMSRLNKRCDIIFIAINDQADMSLFPIGIFGACAYGSNEKIAINTESIIGRESYALQWKENRKQLHEFTSRLQIPTIELTTESDINQDLLRGLKNIVKRKNR